MAEGEDAELRRALDVVQSMIEISAERLEGLRTKCSTSAELTQQEIRTLEGKLIKLYSKQLVTKSKLSVESLPLEMRQYPSLSQWLRNVCTKAQTLEALKEKTERELSTMLGENNSRHEEELRRLCRALHNLRRYIDVLLEGDKDTDMNLYWDSWDRHQLRSGPSPRPVRSRTTRSSVPSEDSIPYHNNINVNNDILSQSSSIICLTNSPPSTPRLNKHERANVKFPTTPPPNKKQNPQPPADVFPLTKSKSHESQLANRLENGETEHPRRIRLPTEPGSGTSNANIPNDTLNISSPLKSPPYSSAESDDNSFKGTVTSLQKQMFIGTGLKCKECKYKCHRDCESKVPPSCGLPQELFDEFKRTLQADSLANASPTLSKPGVTSPNHHHHISNLLSSLNRKDRKRPHLHSSINIPFTSADSSSTTSSCNSSTPSSPALLPGGQTTSQTISVNVTSIATSTATGIATHLPTVKQQFHFPEVTLNEKTLMVDGQHSRLDSTIMSSDSDKTVSVSGSGSVSTDSERTPDILMHCWSYHADKRPDFAKLLSTLEKLPKKRLARSPSHPIQMSRSAESVF
ncbi:Similar to Ksr1: Kinase suppressor of Ras 1 (Mus musculus), partial [Cotesia congregata]